MSNYTMHHFTVAGPGSGMSVLLYFVEPDVILQVGLWGERPQIIRDGRATLEEAEKEGKSYLRFVKRVMEGTQPELMWNTHYLGMTKWDELEAKKLIAKFSQAVEKMKEALEEFYEFESESGRVENLMNQLNREYDGNYRY